MPVFAGFLGGLTIGTTGVGNGDLIVLILLVIFSIAPVAAIKKELSFAGTPKFASINLHRTILYGHGVSYLN